MISFSTGAGSIEVVLVEKSMEKNEHPKSPK